MPHRLAAPIIRVLLTCLLFSLAAAVAAADAPAARAAAPEPANLDLERGELGDPPEGWISTEFNDRWGFEVALTDGRPQSGKRCAVISREKPSREGFGNLMQVVDATPYRGKRVRLRASVRTEVARDGQAALWFRVDRPDGGRGFFDNMGDRPIVTDEWKEFEIVGEVAADAVDVNFGMMLMGRGKAWLDSVSLEILGDMGGGDLPPRALEGRALDNLVAFAKLLGYVRYFHPSAGSAETDWNTFAIRGVRAVEPAKDASELSRVLEDLFRPIAPTVQVFAGDEPPQISAELKAPPQSPPPAVVFWRHLGVGTGSPRSIYSSKVVESSGAAAAGTPDAPPARPDQPFTSALGGGVSGVVPLALYVAAAGAKPAAEAPAAGESAGAAGLAAEGDDAAQPADRPAGWIPSGRDRPTRLAGVVLAWNVFQHFYPYFDVVQTDWNASLRAALASAATDDGESEFLATLRRLVRDLHDGHGRVSHGAGLETHRIPVLWDWIEDSLVVTDVGGKAAQHLQPGDVVLEVNGVPSGEALAELETRISGATPQWIRYRSLVDLAIGPQGSEVRLAIRSASGEPRTVTLERDTPPWGDGALLPAKPDALADLGDGLVYLDMGRTDEQAFADAVPALAKAKAIVFDLRGYPRFNFVQLVSHLIGETVTSAQWHVPVPRRPDREGMQFNFSNWTVQPKEPRFTTDIAFLTYGGAISAAETFLGIVEHYRLGEIVGEPTAGTNGNVNPFAVPGGYRFFWTGMKVLKHDGARHHGVGILPTVPVSRTIRGVAAGRDEQLERAIELLRSKRET